MQAITIPATIQWAEAAPQPEARRSLTLSPQYMKLFSLSDECMMAIAFGYADELLKKLYQLGLPKERDTLQDLFNSKKVYCEVIGVNFVIRNTEV